MTGDGFDPAMALSDEDYTRLGLQAPPIRIDPPGYPACVAGLVERAAAVCPDHEALTDEDRSYTFSELEQAVEAAAALLAYFGIRSGDRVAASLGNECSLVIAFFAAMRLGVVWVGINKVLARDDKRFILSHSGARLLISDTSMKPQVDAFQAETPELDAVWYLDDPDADGGWAEALASPAATTAPSPEIDPHAPAAIMYTSGTTGVPKGVVHSQHNMIVVPAAQFAHGLMAPDARRAAVLPLTVTNLMILGPVSAFLQFRPFLFAPGPKIDTIVDGLHALRIEEIALVPTMVYDLLQSDRDLPDGIFMLYGGAPLSQPIREAFLKRYGFGIVSSYGLTEAPTIVALGRDGMDPEGASGRPIPHLEVTIRDEHGALLPSGVVGEVCLAPVTSGPWAGVYTPPLGYWREPEKTAALLRGGVVHTGDHGILDEHGWLTIADRSSELILRGGSNVYPAEIERVLHMHDQVADCVVIGRPDPRMGMLTLACIIPAETDADTVRLEDELRALCMDRLARYKVPDEWRFMTGFPRNAMGKVVKPELRDLIVR